ncbi:MAG: hypothetical protein LBS36_04170 [Oscillospiraceae bacterium]|jgi:hypothetical protein|nr:hypothetical protein [Oscillospiraceae bacterium]
MQQIMTKLILLRGRRAPIGAGARFFSGFLRFLTEKHKNFSKTHVFWRKVERNIVLRIKVVFLWGGGEMPYKSWQA